MRLGGYDWDQRLVDLVAEKFIRQHHADPREDPVPAGKLWRECEDAKRTLSARQQGRRGLRLPRACRRGSRSPGSSSRRPRRTCWTARGSPPCRRCKAAGLDWNDIDRVLLVGGSTRMPMVRDMLRQLSGKEPDDSVAADEAVAHGAALHASLILAQQQGLPPAFKIRNVNSHSLGVVGIDPLTQRRRNGILIPRNTPLPVTAKRTFKTHEGRPAVDPRARSSRARARRPTTARRSATARSATCRPICRPSRRWRCCSTTSPTGG